MRGHMQFCWGWPLSVAWNGQLATGTDLGLCWPRLQAEEDSRAPSRRIGRREGSSSQGELIDT